MPNRPYVPGDETIIMTIQRFIAQEERLFPDASGTFSSPMRNLALAEEFISGKR